MDILLLAGIFFAISTLFSMLGMGGGILYVPLLLFAGYGIGQAPSISLFLITATSLAALYTFVRSGRVDWKLALVIDPPTDLMAFVGGYWSGHVSAEVLETLLAVILAVAGAFMLRRRLLVPPSSQRQGRWLWHRAFGGARYAVHVPMVVLATALIGLLSGMLGITGGVFKLPIMVLLCGVPMDIAVATSTAMVALTAMFGLGGHLLHAPLDMKTALLLGAATLVGGLLGSNISLSVDRGRLKRLFGIVLWLIALRVLWQTWL